MPGFLERTQSFTPLVGADLPTLRQPARSSRIAGQFATSRRNAEPLPPERILLLFPNSYAWRSSRLRLSLERCDLSRQAEWLLARPSSISRHIWSGDAAHS